ncbi:MAG: hypothetical protein IJL14_02945 [Selenomonadaceae bacterium]|nr:hypothetical protein [Selenomonadaceae bacterium]
MANNTLTGSSDAEVFIYDGGNDVITNYSGEDTVQIASGSINGYSIKNGDLIFKIGSGSLTLKNMANHSITIKNSSGRTSTNFYGTGYTAQEVIKNLVKAWTKTLLTGTAELDESIQLCSHFKSISAVINQMVADCKAAGDGDTFLRKYCGIILDNADTGAITGWDAGGSKIKTAANVIPETSTLKELPSYTNSSFVRNNVTINIAENLSSLTADGKKVLNALYSWWAEESLSLIEESYGVKFEEGDTINFSLMPSSSYWALTSGTDVKINMGYTTFNGDDDYNGNGVDRTIAHEFTHVAQNLFMGYFPQFLEEGLAELTHGIDDMRQSLIKRLAENPDALKGYLNVNNYNTGSAYYYAAGYMFYRYLAKQTADAYDKSTAHAWEDNVLISGTSKAELLSGSGDYVTLSAGSGNDTLTAYGDSMEVIGGAGNDFIYSDSAGAIISGGKGNDTMKNYASKVSISGDDGNDYIYNYDASKITICGGKGNDHIRNGDGSKILFQYVGGYDTIYGFDSTCTLQIGDGTETYSTTTIGSNVVVTTGNGKITLSGAATLSAANIKGEDPPAWTISGSVATYTAENNSVLKVIGVTSLDGISLDGNVVIISAASLGKNRVTVTGDYTLALSNDVAEPSTSIAWKLNGTTATYNQTTTAGYTLTEDASAINYSTESVTTLATVKGVKSTSGLKVSGNVITVAKASVNAKNITVTGDYTLALADNVTRPSTTNSWSLNNSTATLKQTTTAGYTLEDNVIIYSKKSTANVATVTGVKSTSGLKVSGNVITVSKASVNAKNITVTGDYTLALADNVAQPSTTNSWSLNNSTATLKQTTTAGYTLEDNVIIYSKKSTANVATVTGVKSTSGLKVNGNVITVSKASVNAKNITVTSDYTLALADNVAQPSTTNSWSLNNSTATLKQTTTAGYTLEDNVITYSKKITDTLATVDGAKSLAGISMKNNIVTLKAGSLESNVSVSGSCEFNFAAGNYKGASISGSDGKDIITSRGRNISIDGGKGKDTIKILGSATTIVGGKGNDSITSSGNNNLFVYASGDGNDVIADFSATDKIKITKGTASVSTSGDDVIVKVGNGKMTLKNAAGQDISIINVNGKENVYSTTAAANVPYWFTEDDSNFNAAQLDSIVETSAAYSLGEIETSKSITQENILISYSDKK